MACWGLQGASPPGLFLQISAGEFHVCGERVTRSNDYCALSWFTNLMRGGRSLVEHSLLCVPFRGALVVYKLVASLEKEPLLT